jgi:hypothetical protein
VRLTHWLPKTGPRRAALAATIATLGLIGDLAMITMFTASGTPIRLLHEDRHLFGLPRVRMGSHLRQRSWSQFHTGGRHWF